MEERLAALEAIVKALTTPDGRIIPTAHYLEGEALDAVKALHG